MASFKLWLIRIMLWNPSYYRNVCLSGNSLLRVRMRSAEAPGSSASPSTPSLITHLDCESWDFYLLLCLFAVDEAFAFSLAQHCGIWKSLLETCRGPQNSYSGHSPLKVAGAGSMFVQCCTCGLSGVWLFMWPHSDEQTPPHFRSLADCPLCLCLWLWSNDWGSCLFFFLVTILKACNEKKFLPYP